MLDAIKPLLDSDLINEETRQAISEEWEGKMNETRETIRAELREEFAQRYEHDKSTMVEALDRMVTEGLQSELEAVSAEKQALAEDRVKFQTTMKESADKFDTFMVSKLAEELTELRKDRKAQTEGFEKLEQFVVGALAEEIKEFAEDKKDLVETRVKIVSQARDQLESLKSKFVSESAKKMSQSVSKHLKDELGSLREDIKEARENNFGRRIFEAFASEFGATHLNENAEVRKLMQAIEEKDRQLAESIEAQEQAKVLVESKEKEIRMITESNARKAKMEELCGSLNEEKRDIMMNLLESVQTSRLEGAFDKYLPAVLSEGKVKADKKVITESKTEVTGDKTAKVETEEKVADSNVIEIKRLAGL